MLEDLRLLDGILAAGHLYPPLGIHFRPQWVPKRMFKLAEPREDVPIPNTWLVLLVQEKLASQPLSRGRRAVRLCAVAMWLALTVVRAKPAIWWRLTFRQYRQRRPRDHCGLPH